RAGRAGRGGDSRETGSGGACPGFHRRTGGIDRGSRCRNGNGHAQRRAGTRSPAHRRAAAGVRAPGQRQCAADLEQPGRAARGHAPARWRAGRQAGFQPAGLARRQPRGQHARKARGRGRRSARVAGGAHGLARTALAGRGSRRNRGTAVNRFARIAILAVAAGAGLFAAWRIVGLVRADAALAAGDPQAALRWRPANPDALLALAERQSRQGDLDAAGATARALLRARPIDGGGYRVLADIAARHGQPERAQALYRIAVKRDPRDARARAWLAERALAAGDHAEALRQVDRVLAFRPAARAGLFPQLARMAADPAFADALATMLATRPPWRAGLLAHLQA